MYEIAVAILPLILIGFVGFLAARVGVVERGMRKPLLDFCLNFGIPALVFKTIAEQSANVPPAYGVWTAYLVPAAVCWMLASALTKTGRHGHHILPASMGMASTYGNVLMLGIPFALMHFGSTASSTIAMLVLVHSPVLFAAAAIHTTLQPPAQPASLAMSPGMAPSPRMPLLPRLAQVGYDLVLNPIIVAVLFGFAYRAAALPLPSLADQGLTMLGQSTLPCVLVALGIGLSSFQLKGRLGVVCAIVALKLAVLPVLVWWVGTYMLQLDATTVAIVVFLAAMPVGANALAFAEGSQGGADSVAAAVALSTVLSPLTLAAVLWLIGPTLSI